MGLDVDKFELRAFIQFELGIEGAPLPPGAQRRPAAVHARCEQLLVSTLLMTPVLYKLAYAFLPAAFFVSGVCSSPWKAFLCVGLILSIQWVFQATLD